MLIQFLNFFQSFIVLVLFEGWIFPQNNPLVTMHFILLV